MSERISDAEAADLSTMSEPLTVRLLAADLLDARKELAALHAILDGRTTPPTRAEVVAHCKAGGAWLVTVPRRRVVGSMLAPTPEFADDANAQVFDDATRCLVWMREGPVTRVIALGRDRRPCAWPTVTP